MRVLLLHALFLFAFACADTGPPLKAGSMIIVNQSQYPLEELRMHHKPSYLDSPNLLEGGLAIGEEVLFFGDGEWFLTVLRERYRAGPILAFTTGESIELARQSGYQLTVFDESFRFEDRTWIDPDLDDRPYLGDPGP